MTHSTKRAEALRRLLRERQQVIQRDLQDRITRAREGRTEHGRDHLECSDDDAQEHVGLALLQMKTDLLTRVEEAIRRLDAGRYGACAGCGREIAARRLRALPFAVRCQACEERRETLDAQRRRSGSSDGGLSPLAETDHV